MRTLILILICAVFVGCATFEARAQGKDRRRVWTEAGVALAVALVVCWVLVYVVGIFDNWQYSLRS